MAMAARVDEGDGWDLSAWAASTTLAFDVSDVAGAAPVVSERKASPTPPAPRDAAEVPAMFDDIDGGLRTALDWREVMPPTIIKAHRRVLPPHLRTPIVVGACALSSAAAGCAMLLA